MKIQLNSVLVDDQQKALKFYTEVLGFVKKRDIPLGDDRWLTVVSAERPKEIELLLEPNSNPAASAYQKALFAQGIPITAFSSSDVHGEYARMRSLRVAFTAEPSRQGMTIATVFNDTCGNLIQIYQVVSA